MRETVVKVNEKLDRQGKRLADVSAQQLCDLLNESQP